MVDWVSVMAITLVCEEKSLPSGTNLGGCFPGDDDIRSRAVDDCFRLGLLLGGDRELVQCVLKVVQKRLPLRGANLQMGMRLRHRLTCVFLRTTCSPADHLSDQVLEARRRYAMVRFVHQGIGIQSGVYHDSVNEVVHHGSDAIHATKSVVERGLFQWLIWRSEEHTSELQSHLNLVCRLLLEKKKKRLFHNILVASHHFNLPATIAHK